MKFSTKGDDYSSSSGNVNFIRAPRKGDTRVRFLQETTEWGQFREHYTVDRKSFPCPKHAEPEAACPGCDSDNEGLQRRSRKYVSNVLFTNGQVGLLKMPITLVNKLNLRAERNGGTITSRDYTLIRTGEGLETEYDVEQEDKIAIDLSKYRLLDIEQALTDSYDEIWGNAPAPVKSERFASVTTLRAEASVIAPEEDIPPTEPRQEQDADEETRVLTMDDLMEMSKPELVDLAIDQDFVLPAAAELMTIEEVRDFLIDSMEKVQI